MGKRIELKEGKFVLDGAPFFIYSGEIHYFRIPENELEDRILKAKEAGLNTISSYIPWRLHEKIEGKFNFDDFLYFLDIIKKHKLYFIARVGPICHGEMKNDGLPDWLFEKYPEIKLKQYDGSTNPYSSVIDFTNEVFLEQVRKWYSNLLPIISKNQITKDGNIILIQLDNEISMINWLSKSPNYSEENTKRFQSFLKEKYKTIENLNKNYKTEYKNFEEISQPLGNTDTENLVLLFDWAFYYRVYYAKYYYALYKEAKKHKIDIPFLANIPQELDYSYCGRGLQGLMTTVMFRDFHNFVHEIIFGGAYQFRHIEFENFHDIHLMTECVKMITTEGIPSICAEMQTGALYDKVRIYPQDIELDIKTSISSGLQGMNCYMFCGGINKDNNGGFGTYHEWQAPVDSKGNLKNSYKTLKEIGDYLKFWNNKIASTEKYYDTTIGFYFPYYVTEYFKGEFSSKIESMRDNYFFDGIARLLAIDNYSFKLIDLQRTPIEKLKKENSLWVFSLDFMDFDVQSKLYSYLLEGGNLFLYPQIPVRDNNFQNENFLMNKIGVKKIKNESPNVNLYFFSKFPDEFECFGGNNIYIFDVDNCDIIAKTKTGNICGFKKKIGKGNLIVMGVSLNYLFDYQLNIIDEIAKMLGIKKALEITPFDVNGILRYGSDANFLFLNNYHPEERDVKVKLNKFGIEFNTFLRPKSGIILPINTKIDEKFKIIYSNVELYLERKSDYDFLILKTNPNKEVSIFLEISGLKNFEIEDAKLLKLEKIENKLLISFIANKNLEKLKLSY